MRSVNNDHPEKALFPLKYVLGIEKASQAILRTSLSTIFSITIFEINIFTDSWKINPIIASSFSSRIIKDISFALTLNLSLAVIMKNFLIISMEVR